jgi:hypothetical protein
MEYISYIACTTAGLILSAIAFVGLFDISVQPIEAATILLQPSGLGEIFDDIYLWIDLALGFWLILFFWVRTASAIALALVLFKIVLLHGWIPLVLTIGLCLLLTLVIGLTYSSQSETPSNR